MVYRVTSSESFRFYQYSDFSKNTVYLYLESMTSSLLHIIVLQDLEYRDGLLVAGSLDALIELLMPTESHYPEKTYSYAFILCSRLFIRPYELLARVSRVRHSPPPPPQLSLSLSLLRLFVHADVSHAVKTAHYFRPVTN